MWVNCFYVRDLETPFGGARDSGIGREGGHHSFDFYSDVKTVVERTALFSAADSDEPTKPPSTGSHRSACAHPEDGADPAEHVAPYTPVA